MTRRLPVFTSDLCVPGGERRRPRQTMTTKAAAMPMAPIRSTTHIMDEGVEGVGRPVPARVQCS